jgi:hypothetical protein
LLIPAITRDQGASGDFKIKFGKEQLGDVLLGIPVLK